jgi:hypothetical protein
MNWRRISLCVLVVTTMIGMAPGRASAQCAGALAAPFVSPSELNREGRTERPADLSIATPAPQATQTCFVAGNSIRITYNATLTDPTAVSNATPNNFSVTDANNTLVVNFSTTFGVGPSGKQTVIQIDVVTGTTSPLASIVVKNLRFDVTTLGDASNFNAFVSSTSPPTTPVSTTIGTVRNTINPLIESVSTGSGIQSAGGPLTSQATLTFESNPSWAGTNPFRVAIGTPVVSGDHATTATSLTFDVEEIPAGVTVSFPATLTIQGAVTWTAKSATLASTGPSFVVTYNTTKTTATSSTFFFTTGPVAADSTATTPITIGVQISNASGNGTATIRAVFGPGEGPAPFPGDDTGAAAEPRYIASITTSLPSRHIIGKATGDPQNFFTIAPTQTILLYPYVTDLDGYNTGIAVANTGSDSTLFKTKGQTGSVTIFFFPSNAASFSVTVPASTGRGLNGNGQLAPGAVFAAGLDNLLEAAGQTALVGKFDGYAIVLCQFNYGHGFAITFNPAAVGTATEALVLGNGSNARGGLSSNTSFMSLFPEILVH